MSQAILFGVSFIDPDPTVTHRLDILAAGDNKWVCLAHAYAGHMPALSGVVSFPPTKIPRFEMQQVEGPLEKAISTLPGLRALQFPTFTYLVNQTDTVQAIHAGQSNTFTMKVTSGFAAVQIVHMAKLSLQHIAIVPDHLSVRVVTRQDLTIPQLAELFGRCADRIIKA